MSGKSIVVESQPFAKDVDSLVGFFVPSTQQEGSREVSLCRSSAVNKDDFFCRDVLSLSGPDEARILYDLAQDWEIPESRYSESFASLYGIKDEKKKYQEMFQLPHAKMSFEQAAGRSDVYVSQASVQGQKPQKIKPEKFEGVLG